MSTRSSENPEKIPKPRGRRNAPPFTAETAPRNGGRPVGSVSLSAAYRRALAELDPTDLEARRTYADSIAQKLVTRANAEDLDAAKELRIATEGETVHTDGNLEIEYVNDWRHSPAAEAAAALAARWADGGSTAGPSVQLDHVRSTVAQNLNGHAPRR